WVWELMESTEIEEEGSIIKAAICKINVSKTSEIKYCNIIVHGGSDSSTSNFINHLTSVHGLTKDNYETKLNSKLDRALALFIIEDLQPLHILKSPAFIKFLNLLDSSFIVPKSNTIKSLIHTAYTKSFNYLVEQLSSIEYVGLTCDLWTARSRLGYLGVTCSYIDEGFDLHENLLTLMYLPSTHTSPLIAQALNDIIISWRIDKKVMSITTDNGPNMVAAFK
ncbi:20846_t:CDS:2, partial [Entrophospora sp. SA101]